MKLTPAMKQTLQWMKDKNLRITKSVADSKYYLRSDNEFLKTIKFDWMVGAFDRFLTKTYENHTSIYRLRADAEFTQEWLDGERKRIAQEAKKKREDADAEKERLNKEATELFGCTAGLYTVQMQGEGSFRGEIYFGEVYLMGFNPEHVGRDDTIQDVLDNVENKEKFAAIRKMIRAANQTD